MQIETLSNFKKSYTKRFRHNKKIVIKINRRIDLFRNDPKNPILDEHSLKGSKIGYRSFSITGNIRIIYLPIYPSKVLFYDIGTHNQVYN